MRTVFFWIMVAACAALGVASKVFLLDAFGIH